MSNESSTIRLLIWDDLDMKASLASVLVSPPASEPGADLEAVFLWLSERCRDAEDAEACLFTAIEPGNEDSAAQYITDVRNQGFAVMVRPASRASSAPLSGSVRAYVDRVMRERVVRELVVASHDADGLRTYLEELSGRGVAVTVLGFRERAQFAADSPQLDFIDVETIDDVFAFPLPRTNLYDLPEDGVALPPLRKPARTGARLAPSTEAQPAPAAERLSSSSLWSPEGTSDVIYPAPAYSPPASTGTEYNPAPALGDYTPAEESSYYSPAEQRSPEDEVAGTAAEANVASEPPPSPLTSGLFGSRSAGLLGDDSVPVSSPPPPPPPLPQSVDALDDLLAGVQASPITPEAPPPPSPLRPGRVSPPNGLPD